jgi:hypothetical protein
VSGPGRFNFSRAVREWCFVQLPLLDLRQLRDAAKTRGLDEFGLLSEDPWEVLDREEIFAPVAYARHGQWHYDREGSLEDGDLTIREEVGHRPWSDIRDEAVSVHGADAHPQILYHHWQLLWLAQLQDALRPGAPLGRLGHGFEAFYELRAKFAAVPEPVPPENLRAGAIAWRARELLLIRVQNVFFPFQRGGARGSNWLGGPVSGLTDERADWAIEQLRGLDYATLANDCGIGPEDLEQAYEALAYEGLRIDPNAAVFDLLDQVRRPMRERLRGAARLAVDHYDAARVLRAWLVRLGGDEPPDVDELRGLNGTEFKQRHYGTPDVRGNRAVLPIILEDYDLYPWRVQLICEGDSENAALKVIVEEGYGLSFESLGIAVTDMGGSDIPAKAEELLSSFRRYTNYFLLVFDNEGRAQALIEELERAQVIEGVGEAQQKAIRSQAAKAAAQIEDAEARLKALRGALERARDLSQEPGMAPEFQLWRENFEADNFTVAEICAVITDFADEIGLVDFELDPEEVEGELKKKRSGQGAEERGVASVALSLATAGDPGFRLSKPDFARRLARFAMANPQLGDEERPILALAEHLVALTSADRRLAGGLRE